MGERKREGERGRRRRRKRGGVGGGFQNPQKRKLSAQFDKHLASPISKRHKAQEMMSGSSKVFQMNTVATGYTK